MLLLRGLHLWHITIKCNGHPYIVYYCSLRGLCWSVSISQNTRSSTSSAAAELPSHWKRSSSTFPARGIRNTLFKAKTATGKPELVFPLKLWWYPPQPPLFTSWPPASADLFVCRPLFLWMPLKMWLFPLACVRPDCGKHRLTAAGIYSTVRKVLDIRRLVGPCHPSIWSANAARRSIPPGPRTS